MPAAAIAAGAGIAIPAIANKLGIGKNDTRAKTFNETSAYDPHAFQYGGREGTADQDAQYFRGQAVDAQGRAAPQTGLINPNYGRANYWEQRTGADRANQGMAARMMMARAQGLVPSIAGQQAALDMQRATAAQSSAAASARGAGGLALAGQNAANNTATMQSAISNNAQINAAQERLAAEQGAFGAYSGIRQGDFGAQQQASQQAQYQAQLAAQQNQYNAGLQAQRNAQNDAYSIGMYGHEADVRRQQMYGGIQGQQMLNQSTMNATNQNVAISQNNANREYDYYKQATKAAEGGVSAATMTGTPAPTGGGGQSAGSPPPLEQYRANGGPVAPGRPYVVGERGPELIVPAQPGLVYPAEHPYSRAAVGSDDRMKQGMSPLGLLGVYGGSSAGPQNPVSGPVGSGGGMAPSSYEVLSGGGEDVGASGRAMSNVATQYQSDPTGGMQSGGLLSDDHAKQGAYALGKAHGRQDFIDDVLAPKLGNDPTDMGSMTLAQKLAYANTVSPVAGLIDYVTSKPKPKAITPEPGPRPMPTREEEQNYADEARQAAEFGGEDSIRRYPGAPADPVTQQFAQGLAPIRFQYKPGMGPGGEQTGVRAQAAASQPVTASMVTKRPDGLLQLDPQMGLGTALAGVGHLAKKQQDNEAKLNGLLAMTARREGY